MQIDFYGKAKGSASSKYDVWLNCVVNSQNINANTSNVTFKFYIKRNDGYSDSAYNLYENRNTVKISVGGKEKVNKYITIDTRNNVRFLLAEWTGNVLHNDDGTLSLAVSAEFTMDNVTVTGGSAGGVLSLSAIPRKSTMSFSSTTVNPGGSVSVTINSKSASFNHKIVCASGTKSYTTQLEKGVLSATLVVPAEWIEEFPSSSKINVKITLTTFNGTLSLGTNSYNLSLVIPATDEYKPTFDIGIEKVTEIALPVDAFVQNISKVTVSPQNLQFKYGASLAAVTITVGNVSIRKIPATFLLTDKGAVKVTVAVRDSRGLLTVKETTINVLPYILPSVEIINIYRCNEEGAFDRYGESLYVKYNSVYSSLESFNECFVTAQYKTSNDEGFSSPVLLRDGGCIIGEGNISVGNSYTVRFCVGDSVTPEREETLRYISSANIPFNIKSGGNGAAFGKFSETENELSVGWNLSVDGDVNINGIVSCEELSASLENISYEVIGRARYYPCFQACFLHLRFKVSEISANTLYTLGHLSKYPPKMFTPLQVFLNTESTSKCTAGISYEDGAIVFKCENSVPADSFIYVSGFYLIN